VPGLVITQHSGEGKAQLTQVNNVATKTGWHCRHRSDQAGAGATWVAQIGTHGQCDGPPNPGGLTYTSCGDANSFNTSHTLLNEPADIAVDPNPDPVTHTLPEASTSLMGTETIGWSSIRPAMEEKRTNTIGNGALGAN
jgi:hypothetical protein